jgi:acetyl-CoA carboxylase carboxyltransferase component
VLTLPLRARVPGAVSARHDQLEGRPVVVCDIDPSHRKGALTEADGETLATAADSAVNAGVPLVVFVASSGADVHEGVGALHGWGTAALAMVRASGVVPMIFAVTGPAVSGPALLLGLADHVVMTEDAYAFLSGPRMVRAFTGVPVSVAGLGGVGPHARASGLASLVVRDRDAAFDAIAELISLLPANVDGMPPRFATVDPADRETPELLSILPSTTAGSYDVREVVRCLVDDGELLELRASWAGNIVTGLATIAGRPIGVVANQPMTIAGTLDISASQKAARFVSFCDSFNLPIVTLVDTPGFYPGKDLEWRGMIRHGAQMAFAYARATVPRVSLTMRKSYGGAYIVMDSKRMGCDIALAWPSAEIAVMGARGAIEILHRRALDADERERLEDDYEERMLNPYVAAERGLVDSVIDPRHTRREVSAALEMLQTKRESLVTRAHDNTPL